MDNVDDGEVGQTNESETGSEISWGSDVFDDDITGEKEVKILLLDQQALIRQDLEFALSLERDDKERQASALHDPAFQFRGPLQKLPIVKSAGFSGFVSNQVQPDVTMPPPPTRKYRTKPKHEAYVSHLDKYRRTCSYAAAVFALPTSIAIQIRWLDSAARRYEGQLLLAGMGSLRA